MNIDIIKINDPAYRLCRDILKGHGLTQHVTQPTRNNYAILDYISTNIPSRVKHTGVIQCPEISEHDCQYIITDTKLKPFESRYKAIRSMKDFDQQHYKTFRRACTDEKNTSYRSACTVDERFGYSFFKKRLQTSSISMPSN